MWAKPLQSIRPVQKTVRLEAVIIVVVIFTSKLSHCLSLSRVQETEFLVSCLLQCLPIPVNNSSLFGFGYLELGLCYFMKIDLHTGVLP